MCDASLSPTIFYHHILPLSGLQIFLKAHFELRGTQDMVKTFSFAAPFKPGLLRRIIYSVLEGGRKCTKIGLEMGVTIGGDAAKSDKNTHLLVIMRMRLSQKIGQLELTNWPRFKKGNG